MRHWLKHGVWLLVLVAGGAVAAPPTVAVTDLTYESKVKEYFKYVEAHRRSQTNASSQGGAGASSAQHDAQHSSDYIESAGSYTYIDRGELRGINAAIKGAIIKSGLYRVVQAKPYLRPERGAEDESEKAASEQIHDIVERIKKGYFPNADYVLVGVVSSVEFRNEAQPIQGTSTVSRTLGLELVVDFSLVNTKTYEVKAGFNAMGEGQDIRLIGKRGAVVSMNRGKVISETSKSLAEDVIEKLTEQVATTPTGGSSTTTSREEKKESVIIYR